MFMQVFGTKPLFLWILRGGGGIMHPSPLPVVGNSCESLHVLIKHCVSFATNGGTQLLHKLAP